MAIFLGIDGGGSQTSCLIGDESSILGSGSGPGSNIVRVGEAQARESIRIAIQQACAAANVIPQQIDHTCVGVAGAARPQTAELMRRIVAEFISGDTEIVGDMMIALEAAFGQDSGVIVIAGTGSIAYGRNSTGQTARAGGWGFAVSDEGSGHWIGRASVAAALRTHDEGQETLLFKAILRTWSAETCDKLILMANASPPPDFAGLFPAVLSAADLGDAAARTVLSAAGRELAALANVVIRRLFEDVPTVPVAMAGSVFRNSDLMRQAFYNTLRAECSRVQLNASVVDPVKGALELARKNPRRKPSPR